MEQIPFRIVLSDECYKIVLGNQIMTSRTFETTKDAEDYLNTKPWEIIMTMCAITCGLIKQQTKKTKK